MISIPLPFPTFHPLLYFLLPGDPSLSIVFNPPVSSLRNLMRNAKQMGQHLCCAILDMYDPGKIKFNSSMIELSQIHPQVHETRGSAGGGERKGERWEGGREGGRRGENHGLTMH